jgi:hypothetical protein
MINALSFLLTVGGGLTFQQKYRILDAVRERVDEILQERGLELY